MKLITRQRRSALAAIAGTALLAGSLTAIGAAASPAAAAGTVNCSGSINGKAGGYIRKRGIRNSTVTSSYRSASTVSWSPRAWIEVGGAGDQTTWMTSYIVPGTDGRGRYVTLKGTNGGSVLGETRVEQLYRTSGTAVTGWSPKKVVNGPTREVYTVTTSGVVQQTKLAFPGARFGTVKNLPVTLPSATTVAGVWTTHNGVKYDLLYSINPTTKKLEQIVVPTDNPAGAKKYVVRSIGTGWRYMSVHNCYDADGMVAAKDIVLINPTTGNAVRIRQSNGIGHGTTFSAPVRVGTDGSWKWSGISS
ncbi:hypothetical protein [Nocardioides albus]|uniref:Uncharacterized protein n=1 Tax=Nocardioides albus TaxID=1841 RepID=A0A7W5A0Q0_9ACTN|nr:hypothetical protein [Nocardioides albus]MBB3087320.1 hypothetical protein [Nocardioides albus]GGU08147.1 hypothetical protein GCM10007979_02420 [Nocardioides albus]